MKFSVLTIFLLHKSPPYVVIDYDTSNNRWLFRGGFEVTLIQTISKHFNFTYEIINCNSDWGTELPNNSWTGIIGKIANKVYMRNRIVANYS